MADPNSVWTRVRFIMARWLDPCPDPGEAWCVECELNDGQTLILNALGHKEHLKAHRDDAAEHPESTVCMRVNYGHVPGTEP